MVMAMAAIGIGLGGVAMTPMETSASAAEKSFLERPLGRLITNRVTEFLVLRSKLNLTDEQRRKIHGIMESHRAEFVAQAKNIVAGKRALRKEVIAGKPNPRVIRAEAQNMGNLIEEACLLFATIRSEVRPQLTPEQQALFDQFREDGEKEVDQWLHEMELGK
jgi:Spy/CpxP family protein refolding chaperone